MTKPTRTKLTPPEIARRWGISSEKVVAWIRNGELRAINAATNTGGRPRFLIDAEDLAIFEAKRAVQPTMPSRRHRRCSSTNVTEYF